METANRAREIVRLAAKLSPSAREWFTRDENGVWERLAERLLDQSKERAIELKLDDPTINEAIAIEITLAALRTLAP